jgi:hypothetical protein
MEKVKQYFSLQGRKKIFYLLSVLMVFVILDGVLTEFLIAGGNAYEANAFLAPLVGRVGFMLLKTFGALLCALILWDIHIRNQKLALTVAWLATIGYGVIVLWNSSLFLFT